MGGLTKRMTTKKGDIIPPNCPYCGKPAELVDSKAVYGVSYGNLWLCRACDAYVSAKTGTDEPTGRLAKRDLRQLRKMAKSMIDEFARGARLSRAELRDWIAARAGVPGHHGYLSWLSEEQVGRVIWACRDAMRRI